MADLEGIELTELTGTRRVCAALADARQKQVPAWAKITESDAYVRANFPLCSCGSRQESVRYGSNRTVQEAKALVIEKVRAALLSTIFRFSITLFIEYVI